MPDDVTPDEDSPQDPSPDPPANPPAAPNGSNAAPDEAAFPDHFSGHADDYARFRPTYPDALFDALADRCVRCDLAWDCATGNGQAALGLARRFKRVVATDASEQQIQAAPPHPRVAYAVALAGESPLDDASVDLVTVAQALHWLDPDRFYPEVRRVTRPGGLLAAWTYTLFYAPADDPQADAINRVLRRFYHETVGPYWPPERQHIEARYRSLPFPFEEADAPDVTMTEDWALDAVVGYLQTWSASKRYRAETGTDPVAPVAADLRDAWGDPATVRSMQWDVPMRVGVVT